MAIPALVALLAAIAVQAQSPPLKMGLWRFTTVLKTLDPKSDVLKTSAGQWCATLNGWQKFYPKIEQSDTCVWTNVRHTETEVSGNSVCTTDHGSIVTHSRMDFMISDRSHGMFHTIYTIQRGSKSITEENTTESFYLGDDCKDLASDTMKITKSFQEDK